MTNKMRLHDKSAKIRELATEHGLSVEAADAIASIDVTMTRIRRSLARRELARTVMGQLRVDLEVAHLDVINAVGGLGCEPASPGAEVTVGFIAEQMCVDPSRASRLVGEVVDLGYVRRVASQQDSRRICLELTEKGDSFVESFHEIKWNTFASALGDWSEADLATFAKLLDRFSDWSRSLTVRPGRSPARVREKQDA
jgi:DNA-binding MarR family transcriptional regulator